MSAHVNGQEKTKIVSASHGVNHADVQPKVSPYATRAVAIRVGETGVNYTIPEAIIGQYPTLKDKIRADSPYAPIDLRQVDENVGHTLVHFLFTGEYQTLGIDGLPEKRRASAEFETCVLAYCAARLCGIDALANLTQVKMDEFGPQLSVPDILHAMEEVAPQLPSKEQRLPLQMQSWLKEKLQADPSYFTSGELLGLTGRNGVFDTAVAKAVIGLHTIALLEPPSRSTAAGGAGANESDRSVAHEGRSSNIAANSVATRPLSSHASAKNLEHTQNGGDNPSSYSDESVVADTPHDRLGSESLQPSSEGPSAGMLSGLGVNGGSEALDNLKLTDDEGDAGKVKNSKKSKKKKRKDSLVNTV